MVKKLQELINIFKFYKRFMTLFKSNWKKYYLYKMFCRVWRFSLLFSQNNSLMKNSWIWELNCFYLSHIVGHHIHLFENKSNLIININCVCDCKILNEKSLFLNIFQHYFLVKIRTFVAWLKSTLLMKIKNSKCFDTHIYMKIRCSIVWERKTLEERVE